MGRRYDEFEINGRTKILADGDDATFTAIADTIGRKGAKDVSWSWASPFVADDADDAPTGVPVTWTCTVAWRDGTTTAASWGPTADHRRGMVEAAAEVLRQRGSTVTILTEGEASHA